MAEADLRRFGPTILMVAGVAALALGAGGLIRRKEWEKEKSGLLRFLAMPAVYWSLIALGVLALGGGGFLQFGFRGSARQGVAATAGFGVRPPLVGSF